MTDNSVFKVMLHFNIKSSPAMPTQTMFAVLNAEDESIISQPGVTG